MEKFGSAMRQSARVLEEMISDFRSISQYKLE
jgi:hypothetical protein